MIVASLDEAVGAMADSKTIQGAAGSSRPRDTVIWPVYQGPYAVAADPVLSEECYPPSLAAGSPASGPRRGARAVPGSPASGRPGALGAGEPGGGAAPLYEAPYTLAGDCLLSEDYFQLALGDYDPDQDLIAGYPQNNAYVPEALLALNSQDRGGELMQLYHDWTHGQAWAIAPVIVAGR